MTNKQETIQLESIDMVLQNLRKDKEFYSHGTDYKQWMKEEEK